MDTTIAQMITDLNELAVYQLNHSALNTVVMIGFCFLFGIYFLLGRYYRKKGQNVILKNELKLDAKRIENLKKEAELDAKRIEKLESNITERDFIIKELGKLTEKQNESLKNPLQMLMETLEKHSNDDEHSEVPIMPKPDCENCDEKEDCVLKNLFEDKPSESDDEEDVKGASCPPISAKAYAENPTACDVCVDKSKCPIKVKFPSEVNDEQEE